MNGYNFTERVRKVLALAREEALRLRHEYVGTEHLLLGLIGEGKGVAAAVLENLSADPDLLREKVEATVKRGSKKAQTGPDLPYAARAKKVLELAMGEARDLNHGYVGSEHLLLGLLLEAQGIAAQVLRDAGLTVESARAETLRLLASDPPPRPVQVISQGLDRGHGATGAWRYTDRLRRVLGSARQDAIRRHASHLGTEHLLLAVVQEPEGMAAAILGRLGVDRPDVERKLETLLEHGDGAVDAGNPVMDAAAKKAVDFARVEAQRAGDTDIGTGHLLLGIARADAPVVSSVLANAAVTAERIRIEHDRLRG